MSLSLFPNHIQSQTEKSPDSVWVHACQLSGSKSQSIFLARLLVDGALNKSCDLSVTPLESSHYLGWWSYGGPQVQYSSDMHIAALPSCFLLCWALFGPSKHFSAMPSGLSAMPSMFLLFWAVFRLCQAVFSYAESLFPLPTIFRLCWGLLSSWEHFSATLSTSRFFLIFHRIR